MAIQVPATRHRRRHHLFVAYVGMLNVGLIKVHPGDPKAAAKGGAVAATPGLADFNDKGAVGLPESASYWPLCSP